MLGNKDAVANIAVKSLETARRFYEETLGLKPVHSEGNELIVFRSGKSALNVYRSQYAGTNQATAVTWPAGDNVEGVVHELKSKGVRFEHYDVPDMKLEGDVSTEAARLPGSKIRTATSSPSSTNNWPRASTMTTCG